MDTVTAATIGNVAFLIFIAFVVWLIMRPARRSPGRTAELAELDASIATARHEVTALRDDVARLRGVLGADREDA